jgi:mannosyl-oligosaccharide glucosidase
VQDRDIFEIRSAQFEESFENAFGLRKLGFDEEKIKFGQMLLSGMMGGIGYFHGDAIADFSRLGLDEDLNSSDVSDEEDDYFGVESTPPPQPAPQKIGPYSLFTGVPSRPFFPRGFLWFSVFHSGILDLIFF